MKYDKEATDKLVASYQQLLAEGNSPQISVQKLAEELSVPSRSVIAKLSSLGLYKRKEYTDKRGNPPVKKEEYIERIAQLLEVNAELLESLEKANKNVLILLERALKSD